MTHVVAPSNADIAAIINDVLATVLPSYTPSSLNLYPTATHMASSSNQEDPLLAASLGQNVKVAYVCAGVFVFFLLFYFPCYVRHIRSVRGGKGFKLSKKSPKHPNPMASLPKLALSPSIRQSLSPRITDYLTGTPLRANYAAEKEEYDLMNLPEPSPLNITYDRNSANIILRTPELKTHKRFSSTDSQDSDRTLQESDSKHSLTSRPQISHMSKFTECDLDLDQAAEEVKLGHGKLTLSRRMHGVYSVLDTALEQPLNIPLFRHVTLAQFGVLLVVCGCFAAAVVTRQGPGQIATGMVPFVAATASKNSFLSVMCGKNYSRLNFIHRYLGRLLFLAAALHSGAYLVKWGKSNVIVKELAEVSSYTGLISFGSLILMVATSLPAVRRHLYGLFAWSHVVGFAGFLVGLYIHQPGTLPYVASGAALYVFDIVVRHLKTNKTSAILTPLANGSTLVRVPGLKSGWEAGQHVWLRVGIPGVMGGWHEVSHPFTISNPEDEAGLKLVISSAGDWTRSLHAHAKSLRRWDPEGQASGKAKCLIEGPYTSTGQWDAGNHSAAMLIAGGSGASYVVAMAEELLLRSLRGELPSLKSIQIIWSVRSYSHLSVFAQTLSGLQALAKLSPNSLVKLDIRLHVSAGTNRELLMNPVPGSQLEGARPKLDQIVLESVNNLLRRGETHGLSLCVCGPLTLVNGAKHAVRSVPASKRINIGGARIHAEMFSF